MQMGDTDASSAENAAESTAPQHDNTINNATIINAESVGDYDEATLSRLGPGAAFEVYARCERVIARLKLLNYEREFLPMNNAFKLFPRHYFAHLFNVGEQFFLFTSLAIWLIRRARLLDHVEMPHEFDDPNSVNNNIIEALKKLNLEVAFSPNKLKSGSGPYCVFVLEKLSEAALSKRQLSYSPIEVVANGQNEEDDDIAAAAESGEEDDIEVTAEQFDDDEYDVVAAVDEDDNGAVNGDINLPASDAAENPINKPLKSVLNTFTDPSTMTTELRRVIPQLKITIRSDAKDWKMHIEQVDKHEKEIESHYQQVVRPFLAQNSREIGDAMERIFSRETHLNAQLDHLMQTFRIRQNELASINEKYRESSGTLNSRAEMLANLNEEIEQIKQQIEEQGLRNTNGAPILKIKQSLTKMENAIFTMRVQIVVTDQTLTQSQLSDRLNLTNSIRDPFS